MKKATLFLIVLSFLVAACNPNPENEWERFYGFTQADIVGHYEANPDESLYQELPTEGVQVYDNATIDVVAVGDVSVSVRISIPGVLNRSFTGPLDMSDDERSDLAIGGFHEDFIVTVYKNNENKVRFHGRVKHYYYNAQGQISRSDNWNFDVIKEEDRSKK
jgi:hypothetical protein